MQSLSGPVDAVTAFRFLKAENFVVRRAQARLVANIRWRKKNRADDALVAPCYLATQRRYHVARQLYVLGHDRRHNLLTYDGLGHFFKKGGETLGSWEDIRKVAIWHSEIAFNATRRLSKRLGQPVWQTTAIMDFSGVEMASLKHLPLLAFLDQCCGYFYPEAIAKIIIINVPGPLAAMIQGGLKYFDPGTVEKVELHAGVPRGRLLELIPEDQLPPSLGGTSEFELPGHYHGELPEWHDVAAGVQGLYKAALEHRATLQEDMATIAAFRAESGLEETRELAYTAALGKQQGQQGWRVPLALRISFLALPVLLALPTVAKLLWLAVVIYTMANCSPGKLDSPSPAAKATGPVEEFPLVDKVCMNKPKGAIDPILSVLECCLYRDDGREGG